MHFKLFVQSEFFFQCALPQSTLPVKQNQKQGIIGIGLFMRRNPKFVI